MFNALFTLTCSGFLVTISSGVNAGEKRIFYKKKSGKEDPFQQYLTGKSPEIVKDLGEEIKGDVKIHKLIFHSRNVNSDSGMKANTIFAAIARPAKPGEYPGLLVLHGGGGSAEIDKAEKWAAKGYIVVTLDLPGIANPEKVPFSDGVWKSYAYGKNRFTVKPDITSSTIFDGVLAAVQAFYLLENQANLTKSKIGIAGISWGGYMTTIVSGIVGSKVHASFSVYGSGYYDKGSVFQKELNKMSDSDKELWLKYLDAGRRIAGHKSAFFIAAATNDNWFYPSAVTETLRVINGPVNHLFAANANHKIPDAGGTGGEVSKQPGWLAMELPFFEYHLKGIGDPFPEIVSSEQIFADNSSSKSLTVSFRVKSKTRTTSARIYYSFVDKEWTKREWKELPAVLKNKNTYQAELPQELAGKDVDWYASVSDDRPVSVSGYIQKLK